MDDPNAPALVSALPMYVKRSDGRVVRVQAGDPVALWAFNGDIYRSRQDACHERNPIRPTYGMGWRRKAELDPVVEEMGTRS